MKNIVTTIILYVSLLAAASYASAASSAEKLEDIQPLDLNQPIQVATTTGMIADLVENIGGDDLQVTALMGPGTDPHLYKATPQDLRKLRDADVIFHNGLHLESKLSEVLERLSERSPAFALSDGLDKRDFIAAQGAAGAYDPHIWFDLELWNKCGAYITDILSRLDPANEADYRQRYHDYSEELLDVHATVKREVSSIPEGSRVLITAHDAFGYFGKAYGMEVLGIQGLSTTSEAGVKRVNELVNLLIERDIHAVFIESTISDKNIRALIEGAAAQGHQVTIGGELYSDAMGEQGTEEGTYLGMVRHNIGVIVSGLRPQTARATNEESGSY